MIRPDDIILITGKKRSGKSFFLSNLFKILVAGNVRVVLYDYNWEHNEYPDVTHDLNVVSQLWSTGSRFITFRPVDKSDIAFNQFCGAAYSLTNTVIAVEEIERYANHWITYSQPNLKKIIDVGRHRGLGLLATTRRILRLASDIPFNADHIFIFKQTRPQDLKYLEEWVGPEVNQIVTLPEYSYLWYNDRLGTLTVMPPIK